MERLTITKFSGQIVGFIDVESNGDKTVRDFYGKILGYYRKSNNATTLFSGRIIAFGDVSAIFFKNDIQF
ncbi:MAG: hypothetical protein IK048_03550 [Clostridia bacterium]|nr:hypothetical protein [Clostridia bacterium]